MYAPPVYVHLLIFLVSFVATLLSSMSGGGSSVISLPVFLWLGMSFPLAIAIQKVSAIFWVPAPAWNYLKDRNVDWTFLLLFAAIGLVGAYFGVRLIVSIPQRLLEIGVGIVLLLLVLHMTMQRTIGLKKTIVRSALRRAAAYPFALLMGFYEGVFGSGNGIIFSTVAVHTRGFNLTEAIGYYFAISFFWVTFTGGLLMWEGFINLSLMIPSIIGSVAGAYVGSAYAKYKGNAFMKIVFGVVGGLLGVKLLVGF